MAKTTHISLFIPCLVDQVMPDVGLATARLLRYLGYEVHYDPAQTCCGQPGFNAGHHAEARQVACHCLDVFREAGTIVSPSGSCTSMMRHHYNELFAGHPRHGEALATGGRVVELTAFLHREQRLGELTGRWTGIVGVHKSCHSYRELGLREEPVSLLRGIAGCELVEPPGEPVCCGFGGTFFVKYAPVAQVMGNNRLQQFAELGATTIVVNDPGCIMHLRQQAERDGRTVEILHPAVFLARAMFRDEAAP